MPINAEWHRRHPMPKNPTIEQRVAWHLAHRQHCGCRPIPAKLQQLIDDRGQPPPAGGAGHDGEHLPTQKDDTFPRVMDRLLVFARERDWGREGVVAFVGPDRQIREWEHECFVSYLCYGCEDGGERLVDVFRREAGLSPAETKVVEALQQARFSLWEVQEVRLDEGLDYLNLLTGERLFVREKMATHQLSKLDLTLSWVIWMDDHHELASICGVPRAHREAVLKEMQKVLRKARKASPDLPDHVLLRRAAAPAQRALRAAVESWRPKVVTMDNEEIVFCEAVFDIDDRLAVMKKLQRHPDLHEEVEDRFVWVDHKGRKQLGPGPVVLGTIRVKKNRLHLEVHSKERLNKGKTFLTEILGGLARHRIDSVKDFDVAMAEAKDRPPPESIPKDVQAELLSKFMQGRLLEWIDEQIPALGGKTPRQAVRTKSGRQKVVALLKDQEHMSRQMPGGERLDFSVAYRELGLQPPP